MKKSGLVFLMSIFFFLGVTAFKIPDEGFSFNYVSMQHVVKKTVTISATPEQVWEALTNPELTKKYFFNASVFSNWKAGSAITFKGRILLVKKFEMQGKILEIEKNKLLKYSLSNGSDKGESSSIVTDELNYANGVTTVSITDDVGSGEGAEKRFKRSEKGWNKILKGLKKTVEENK